jgi:uncharacterized membrane protein
VTNTATRTPRLSSIDALRGLVMILMALDHVRDFFHIGAMSFNPADLTRTTPILFLTRWVTHFCMPSFMFTAGLGAFFLVQRRTRKQLSTFLLTRGVWFIFLELAVMQFSYKFSFSSQYMIYLLVLWIFGFCFIVLAPLIYLPPRWLAALSVIVIVLHNCLDNIDSASFGRAAFLWQLIHEPGRFSLFGRNFLLSYPLIPWIAVIAIGFCCGQIFLMEAFARRKILIRTGLALTVAFTVIRVINHYGDPAPWEHQKTAVFTLLSFINCTKYPASLDFLLMTLGPSILFLGLIDRRVFKTDNPLIVFGRVPMFYFVLHFYLIHILVVIAAYVRYGSATSHFIFNPVPSMGGPADLFPPHFGYGLCAVYGFWIATVVILYPICRWFARIKATRHDWWLSYL